MWALGALLVQLEQGEEHGVRPERGWLDRDDRRGLLTRLEYLVGQPSLIDLASRLKPSLGICIPGTSHRHGGNLALNGVPQTSTELDDEGV